MPLQLGHCPEPCGKRGTPTLGGDGHSGNNFHNVNNVKHQGGAPYSCGFWFFNTFIYTFILLYSYTRKPTSMGATSSPTNSSAPQGGLQSRAPLAPRTFFAKTTVFQQTVDTQNG